MLRKFQIDAIKNIVLKKIENHSDIINKSLLELNKKPIEAYKRNLLKVDINIQYAKGIKKYTDQIKAIESKRAELIDKLQKNNTKENIQLNIGRYYNYSTSINSKIDDYIERKIKNKFLLPELNINIEDFIIVEDITNKKDLDIDKLANKILTENLIQYDNNK